MLLLLLLLLTLTSCCLEKQLVSTYSVMDNAADESQPICSSLLNCSSAEDVTLPDASTISEDYDPDRDTDTPDQLPDNITLPDASIAEEDQIVISLSDISSIIEDDMVLDNSAEQNVTKKHIQRLCSTPKKFQVKSCSTEKTKSRQPSCNILTKSQMQAEEPASQTQSQLIADSFDYKNRWQLFDVINSKSGCLEKCVTDIHCLNEYNILSAHDQFTSKSFSDQNLWIIQYFESHCPCSSNGDKDLKAISYIIQGKEICCNMWLEILGISQSRFYRLRNDFSTDGGIKYLSQSRCRSKRPKTMQAIAWMDQYFQRIGDKRPDKEGIFLPTCLTEKKMFEIMVEELYQGEEGLAISYSKFCDVFKLDFKNVTIPKVHLYKCSYTMLKHYYQKI